VLEQPPGIVTLFFSDIEGSTTLLQRLGVERYKRALEQQRRLLREAFRANGGYEVSCEGDSFFVAFEQAEGGVEAAAAARRA
jgi:class 3 adenylate cyclase